MGASAIPALNKALKDENADVRNAAARTLGTSDASHIARRGRWIDQLSDDDPQIRLAAATALADDRFTAQPAPRCAG